MSKHIRIWSVVAFSFELLLQGAHSAPINSDRSVVIKIIQNGHEQDFQHTSYIRARDWRGKPVLLELLVPEGVAKEFPQLNLNEVEAFETAIESEVGSFDWVTRVGVLGRGSPMKVELRPSDQGLVLEAVADVRRAGTGNPLALALVLGGEVALARGPAIVGWFQNVRPHDWNILAGGAFIISAGILTVRNVLNVGSQESTQIMPRPSGRLTGLEKEKWIGRKFRKIKETNDPVEKQRIWDEVRERFPQIGPKKLPDQTLHSEGVDVSGASSGLADQYRKAIAGIKEFLRKAEADLAENPNDPDALARVNGARDAIRTQTNRLRDILKRSE